MRFPQLTELASLTTLEAEALRSLHHACNYLKYEWQTALALVDRLGAQRDAIEDYAAHLPFTHHYEATRETGAASYEYERSLGNASWRYASAYAVLGIAVFDRLVQGRPPLTAVTVQGLFEEPTLAQLRDALLIPPSQLLVARDDILILEMMEERQQQLLSRLDSAFYNVMHLDEQVPMDEEKAGACKLTVVGPRDMDPLYDDLLDPMFALAEQTPFEISQFLAHPNRSAVG